MTVITIRPDNGARVITSRTFDHRTSSTQWGGPASRYHRVERPGGGPVGRPNYAARRVGAAIVASASVFVLAMLLNSVLVSFGGSPASAAEAAPAAADSPLDAERMIHVAAPGDSLWSIADAYRGSVGRERYVDALIELNRSTSIVIGQAVQLP